MFDYRDPYYAGRLNGVLEEFQTPLYLYRIVGKIVGPDGSVMEIKEKYLIYGSLQTWRRKRTYTEDGINFSSRDGKLLVQYSYKINDGDIIQKNNQFYRVLEQNDYDYAEVQDFNVARIGMDEVVNFDFDKYLEKEFSEMEGENDEI